MADRAISALPTATTLTNSDLFVLSQSNQAKNTTWQTIIGYLTTALDGHGGIQTIEKTGTSGNVDTYTITYADESTDTFTVTNGKSISDVTDYYAVSTSDSTEPSTWYTTLQTMTATERYLWNYQTITFNDATTLDTSARVIGVYGDTGQQSFVWIRYSAEEPTSDADISTLPDAWIGIYVGTASTAPTTYTSYTWYQYKGDEGDEGDPGADAELESTSINYCISESGGGDPPSSGWQSYVPTPVEGDYLWTRVVLTFNTGDPVTFYSVAHYGADGTHAPASNTPLMDGTGAVGTSLSYAREDHVHPSDTKKQNQLVNKSVTISASSTAADIGVITGDNSITSNMIVISSSVANPIAQTSSWTVTTTNGGLTVNGTAASATTLTLILGEV